MLLYGAFIVFLYTVSGFDFPRPNPVCKKGDMPCILRVSKTLLASSMPGIPELDVKPLDPMHHDLIEENNPDLEYSLTDTDVKGFKDVIINSLVITNDDNKITMHYDLTLPHYEMKGNYKINGKIGNMPVSGDGKYHFTATDVNILATAVKDFYEKDGIKYLRIVDVRTTTELRGTIHFHLENLFGGDKEMAAPLLKYMNENAKEVAGLWKEPVATANMKLLFDDYSKILATVPVEELVKGG